MTDTTVTDQGQPQLSLRDRMRSDFFNAQLNKPESRIVEFRGYKIEIRQPTLGSVISAQEGEKARSVATTLIQYAFVPGTNDHIFEPEDEESLMQMPFGGDFIKVANALTELTSINFPSPSSASSAEGSSS